MTNTVTSGTFRLKSRFFDENKLRINKHQLSLREQVSYPTVLRYLRQPEHENFEAIENFSGDVLYAILVKGFGLSPDELEDMKLGDLFEVVSTNGHETAE